MRRFTEDPLEDDLFMMLLGAESLLIGALVLVGIYVVLRALLA